MDSTQQTSTAPFTLSVLDNAHTAVGQTVEEAFDEVINLAQVADRLGVRTFLDVRTPRHARRRDIIAAAHAGSVD